MARTTHLSAGRIPSLSPAPQIFPMEMSTLTTVMPGARVYETKEYTNAQNKATVRERYTHVAEI